LIKFLRFQALYLQSEIDEAGFVDIVSLQKGSGNSGTYNNFRIYLCHSDVSSLSSSFSSNCKDSPVKVMDESSKALSGSSSSWVDFDVDNTFEYNNADNLVVEIRWNGDSGDTVALQTGVESSNRRSYNKGSDSSGTATNTDTKAYNLRLLLYPEDCSDGLDNDGDGLIDCEDENCTGFPGCPEMLCEECDYPDCDGWCLPSMDCTPVGAADMCECLPGGSTTTTSTTTSTTSTSTTTSSTSTTTSSTSTSTSSTSTSTSSTSTSTSSSSTSSTSTDSTTTSTTDPATTTTSIPEAGEFSSLTILLFTLLASPTVAYLLYIRRH